MKQWESKNNKIIKKNFFLKLKKILLENGIIRNVPRKKGFMNPK